MPTQVPILSSDASLVSAIVGGITQTLVPLISPLCPPCSKGGAKEAARGSMGEETSQVMPSQLANALGSVISNPPAPPLLPSAPNNSSATPPTGGPNIGASSNNTRIPVAGSDGSANSTNPSVSVSTSNMSSASSSSAWRVQPTTPTNSPALPVDDPPRAGNGTSFSPPPATSSISNSTPTTWPAT
ncbi:hypothetical protein P691DRAFT_812498 [Macrolepiota fuliginosa MF-IS2]|uniref:Uncharacterized protein n=1 Tax=Macrolepiota fuliginosa MF-IS2 TaxID=1400762 RepID=A0A9P5XN58_9AGAR|nr:hypothetical protein P691DRAFT_812498 [Macrolepiota fuliginosa MF-IS2]